MLLSRTFFHRRGEAGPELERRFVAPTTTAAIVLGFAVTLGVWLFAGAYFARRVAEVGKSSDETNARYTRAQELLSMVQTQVLLGSVYLRDALLDPKPDTVETYKQRLLETYDSANRALSEYHPVFNLQAERDQVARLRHEIEDFRATLLQVLQTDTATWREEARDILRLRIVPKRELVIQVSEQVRSLNRTAFVEQQAAIAALYGKTERQVWVVLSLALAASVSIGILATLYARRLEDRLRQQQERDRQSAADLQRLSGKLVRAQEDERRAIARELHDDVGQVLAAIKVELALAQRKIEASGGSAQSLEPARAIADRALHSVRDLSHLLHPDLLDELGLAAAINSHLRAFGEQFEVHVDLLHDLGDARMTPDTEIAAYRIVQEALTNVAKHAAAKNCHVYLHRLSHTLLVTVDDDGRGFDPDSRDGRRNAGLGLIAIRERVANLNGTLRVESSIGRGTRVTVELPARPRVIPSEEGAVEPVPHMASSPIHG
jgi:signal transduction histidine kinase